MGKDYYQVLGLTSGTISMETSSQSNPVAWFRRDGKSADNIVKRVYKDKLRQLKKEYERAVDKLVKERNHNIDVINYGIDFNKGIEKKRINQQRLSEIKTEYETKLNELRDSFEEKKKEAKEAYNHLATERLRKIYEERKGFETERHYLYGDSAYDFFEISEKEIYLLNAFEADQRIGNVYKKTVESLKNWLIKSDIDEETKKEIQKKLSLAHNYYEKIHDMDSRTQYKDELDLEEKKRKEEFEENIIRSYCSKEDQFNPDLIKNINDISANNVKAIIYKKTIDPVTLNLPDKQKREILLTKTGEILFKTSPNNVESYISEYEVSRIVNGEETINKVYANLDLTKLSVDEETNKPYNPEYYDCVVNELLSEVVLRGSKYNNGYVGGVEKDENEKYKIVLTKDELDDSEKEELAAVILYNQQNKQNIENKKLKEEER